MKKIAFLGLGAMGGRMAKRLLDAGFSLSVYNRTASRGDGLVAAGATRAATPREAAAGADLVIGMVTDDEAARTIWIDEPDGAAFGMAPDAIAMLSSTLTPGGSTAIARRLEAAGRAVLEAPVAGSIRQAEAGELVLFLGGEASIVPRVQPVLEVLGKAHHHVGPVGHAARIKLVVNALLAVQVATLAEGLVALEAAGIGVAAAMDILGPLPVTSPAAKGLGALIAGGTYAPHFPVALVAKDLGYAVASARSVNREAPMAAAARPLYERAMKAGLGGENLHAVIKVLQGDAAG